MHAWRKEILHRLEGDRTLSDMAIICRPIAFGPSNTAHYFDDGTWIRTAQLQLVIEYEANRLSLTD